MDLNDDCLSLVTSLLQGRDRLAWRLVCSRFNRLFLARVSNFQHCFKWRDPLPTWAQCVRIPFNFGGVADTLQLPVCVSTLTQLRELSIPEWGHVNDAAISVLTRLEGLSLGRTNVTDAGIRRLTRLRHLRVMRTGVTPAGLLSLSMLCTVDLYGCRVTDDDLIAMTHACTRLHSMNLQKTDVTNRSVSALTMLRVLYLGYSEVLTDACIQDLTRLRCLEVRHVTLLTDRAFDRLTELRRLDVAYCFGTTSHTVRLCQVICSKNRPGHRLGSSINTLRRVNRIVECDCLHKGIGYVV